MTTAHTVIKTFDYLNKGGRDPKILAKAGMDLVMTGVGFLGPVGFAVSTSYFILDNATNGFKEF